jgi:hypothetical protein
VFTASSLLGLLSDLVELDLLPYRCAQFYQAERHSNEMVLIYLERSCLKTASEKKEVEESFRLAREQLGDEEQGSVQPAADAAQRIAELQDRVRTLESEIAVIRKSRS